VQKLVELVTDYLEAVLPSEMKPLSSKTCSNATVAPSTCVSSA
jgi:hypothetical protein